MSWYLKPWNKERYYFNEYMSVTPLFLLHWTQTSDQSSVINMTGSGSIKHSSLLWRTKQSKRGFLLVLGLYWCFNSNFTFIWLAKWLHFFFYAVILAVVYISTDCSPALKPMFWFLFFLQSSRKPRRSLAMHLSSVAYSKNSKAIKKHWNKTGKNCKYFNL